MSQPATYGSGALDRLEVALRADGAGAAAPATAPPTAIGRYDVLELIGQGGMGEVYRAEQRTPVRRTVALKLIKLGMDSREVVRRFEGERQALAWMDHPNVARVLDAGTDPVSGRPYFVMEYVSGLPITRYCDERRLTVRERLELFAQVCDAVAHAHQKMVVHRDLKPSNILVAHADDAPRAKVIDFGVAKALVAPAGDRTAMTELGQVIGTPEYMSPEQACAGGGPGDVDTSTDVYALGVVLYELLAGALPFDPVTLRASGQAGIERTLRDIDPPRPSTRLSGLGDVEAAEVAARRRARPAELVRQLKSELEWIPLKAMRKDRAQRYATVTEFARDIANYLGQQPLLAGPESRVYRVGKLLRRNTGTVVASATVLIVLVAGIIGTSIGLVGQARQRTRAELQERKASLQAAIAVAVSRFQSDMLSSADPDRLLGDKITVLQVVTAALGELDAGKLRAEPLVEASLRATIGQSLQSLGRSGEAEPQLRKALELRRRFLPAIDLDVADSAFDLAVLLQDQGQWEEPPPLFREALDIRRKLLPPAHLKIAKSLDSLGWVLWSKGSMGEAEPLFREALAILRQALPPGHPDLAYGLSRLGSARRWSGDLAEAEVLCREAMELRRKTSPAGHPDIADTTHQLAHVLEDQGRQDEAEPLYREVLEIYRATLPATHKDIARVLNRLGWTVRDQGRGAEAERLFREGLAVAQLALPPGHPNVALAKNSLAYALRDQGRFSEAETLFREALAHFRQSIAADNPDVAIAISSLALVLTDQAKYAEAEPLYREALDRFRKVLPADHAWIHRTLYGLGNLLLLGGRGAEAEPLLAELYASSPRSQGLQGPGPVAAHAGAYGRCLVQLHRYAEAEQPLRQAYERGKKASQPNGLTMRRVVAALAEVCDHTDRSAEAARLRAELDALEAATQPATAPTPEPD